MLLYYTAIANNTTTIFFMKAIHSHITPDAACCVPTFGRVNVAFFKRESFFILLSDCQQFPHAAYQ